MDHSHLYLSLILHVLLLITRERNAVNSYNARERHIYYESFKEAIKQKKNIEQK